MFSCLFRLVIFCLSYSIFRFLLKDEFLAFYFANILKLSTLLCLKK
jgi:hypothetical protein